MHLQRTAIIALSAVGMLGGVLPWVSASGAGKTVVGWGISMAPGILCIVFFLIGVLLPLLVGDKSASAPMGAKIGIAVAAALAALIAILNLSSLGSDEVKLAEALGVKSSAGIGLYMCILAGILSPIACFAPIGGAAKPSPTAAE